MLRVVFFCASLLVAFRPVAAEAKNMLEPLKKRPAPSWSAYYDWEKPTNVRTCAIAAIPISGPKRGGVGSRAFGVITLGADSLQRKRALFRLGYRPDPMATYHVAVGRIKLELDRREQLLRIDSPTVVEAILEGLSAGHALVIAEQTRGNISAVEIYSPSGLKQAVDQVHSDCHF